MVLVIGRSDIGSTMFIFSGMIVVVQDLVSTYHIGWVSIRIVSSRILAAFLVNFGILLKLKVLLIFCVLVGYVQFIKVWDLKMWLIEEYV